MVSGRRMNTGLALAVLAFARSASAETGTTAEVLEPSYAKLQEKEDSDFRILILQEISSLKSAVLVESTARKHLERENADLKSSIEEHEKSIRDLQHKLDKALRDQVSDTPPQAEPTSIPTATHLRSRGTSPCTGLMISDCMELVWKYMFKVEAERNTTESDLVRVAEDVHEGILQLWAANDAVKQDVDTLQATSVTTRNAISDNVQKISALQRRKVGLCDCKNWDLKYKTPAGYVAQNFPAYCSPGACNNDFYSVGGSSIYICRPCMDGDSSFAALPNAMNKPCGAPRNAVDIFA